MPKAPPPGQEDQLAATKNKIIDILFENTAKLSELKDKVGQPMLYINQALSQLLSEGKIRIDKESETVGRVKK